MRARGSAPHRETGTASRPGTRPRPASTGPAADRPHGEHHDHDGHPAHDPGTLLDAWVREQIEAAPPLTGEQRRALAVLLNSPAPVPARPPGTAAPGQAP
ncbi:MAG TPA: hypothetical protein VIY52_06305 [Streptosporangiaceae bacterium]